MVGIRPIPTRDTIGRIRFLPWRMWSGHQVRFEISLTANHKQISGLALVFITRMIILYEKSFSVLGAFQNKNCLTNHIKFSRWLVTISTVITIQKLFVSKVWLFWSNLDYFPGYYPYEWRVPLLDYTKIVPVSLLDYTKIVPMIWACHVNIFQWKISIYKEMNVDSNLKFA